MFVEITQTVEHIDRSFETASWYVRYEVLPGLYPVEDGDFDRSFITVDAIRVEEHFVNRVFQHTALAAQSSKIGQTEQVRIGFCPSYWRHKQALLAWQEAHGGTIYVGPEDAS